MADSSRFRFSIDRGGTFHRHLRGSPRRALTAAIVSERRVFEPYGLAGGDPGRRGRNLLTRKSGQVLNLGGRNEAPVAAGDRVRLETPGGGGYGTPT